jgi:hypothetical protein
MIEPSALRHRYVPNWRDSSAHLPDKKAEDSNVTGKNMLAEKCPSSDRVSVSQLQSLSVCSTSMVVIDNYFRAVGQRQTCSKDAIQKIGILCRSRGRTGPQASVKGANAVERCACESHVASGNDE